MTRTIRSPHYTSKGKKNGTNPKKIMDRQSERQSKEKEIKIDIKECDLIDSLNDPINDQDIDSLNDPIKDQDIDSRTVTFDNLKGTLTDYEREMSYSDCQKNGLIKCTDESLIHLLYTLYENLYKEHVNIEILECKTILSGKKKIKHEEWRVIPLITNTLKKINESRKEYVRDQVEDYFDHAMFLDISFAKEELAEQYWKLSSENKHIVLRPYNGEKILVIGCGKQLMYRNDNGSYCKYPCCHSDEEYTIDPDICCNASIVGFFGDNKMVSLPNHVFDVIVMEGVLISTSLAFQEIKRLASKRCRFMLYNGSTFVIPINSLTEEMIVIDQLEGEHLNKYWHEKRWWKM